VKVLITGGAGFIGSNFVRLFLNTRSDAAIINFEAARRHKLPRFIQISTDEVYGSAPSGESFTERSVLDPRSPYAASKASADHFVSAYANTYGVSTVILRCTNNYGPYQFPEKLIPLMIANAREDKPLPVYGDGMQERDWLFVEVYCRAIALALEKGKTGEVYNVSAGSPQPNLKIVRTILAHLKSRTRSSSMYKIAPAMIDAMPSTARRFAANWDGNPR
jgi:dTDP-glucose 4,6-dehydratase